MEKMKDFLKVNFLPIWHHFLSFEINRSRDAIKMIGSANGYLVFQVICWHHILILMDSSDIEFKGSFRKEAVDLWIKYGKDGFNSNTVLTYSLIGQLTGLSIETVRRQVKKLINDEWVSYSKKYGVKLEPSDKNNKFLADTFNIREVDNLGHLLDVIEKRK